jgi:hypothetical protein
LPRHPAVPRSRRRGGDEAGKADEPDAHAVALDDNRLDRVDQRRPRTDVSNAETVPAGDRVGEGVLGDRIDEPVHMCNERPESDLIRMVGPFPAL